MSIEGCSVLLLSMLLRAQPCVGECCVCGGRSAGTGHHERVGERLVCRLLGDRSTLSCQDGCVSGGGVERSGGCVCVIACCASPTFGSVQAKGKVDV